MILRNFELESVIKFLYSFPLTGKSSRMRTRLINKLSEKYALYEKERIDIANTYAEKNNKGQPIILSEEDGRQIIKLKESEQDIAQKEIAELSAEEAVIELSEENKDMLTTVKESIMNKIDNDENEYFGEEAALRDRVYEILENIKY